MGNRRRHIGSSLAALTLTLSLLTGLLTGCGPGGSQSSSPEAGSTPPAASQSTQTPEQPALPELTTDTYGNAAVGYQAAVVSANEYTSRIGMDILEAGGNAVDAAVAMIFANRPHRAGCHQLGRRQLHDHLSEGDGRVHLYRGHGDRSCGGGHRHSGRDQ